MKARFWCLAVVASCVFHVAVAAMFSGFSDDIGTAAGDGDGGVEIGLGMTGAYVEARASVAPSSPAPLAPVQPAEAPPVPAPQAAPVLPNTPVAAVVDTISAKDIVLSKPQERPQEVSPTRPPDLTQTPVAPSEPALAVNESESSHPNALDQTTSEASVRGTGSAQSKQSGGAAGNAKSYFGTVMAELSRHKRYPAELKKKKKQGVVTLRFSIDKDGNIFAASIQKTSAYAALDSAALAMLREASPLPPIPDEMARESLTLVIPVEYSLITNTTYGD